MNTMATDDATGDADARDLSFTVTLSHTYEVTDAAVSFVIDLIESYDSDMFTVVGAKRHDVKSVAVHVTSDHEFGSVAATHAVDRVLRRVVERMDYTRDGPLDENYRFTDVQVNYSVEHKIGE